MFRVKDLGLPSLVYAVSTISDGNMSFRFGSQEDVVRNRKSFLEKEEIDFKKAICMQVAHSNTVLIADESLAGKSVLDKSCAPASDALITNKKDVFLFLLVADCIPLTIFDGVKQTIGLVHCGWDELDLGIVESVVEKLQIEYKSNPKNLTCIIGPAIRKDSYIQKDPSQKDDPKWSGFVENIEDEKFKVDIVGFCKDRLTRSGVLEKNIIDSEIDTAKDGRFFSHYRDKSSSTSDRGRIACVVGMRQK